MCGTALISRNYLQRTRPGQPSIGWNPERRLGVAEYVIQQPRMPRIEKLATDVLGLRPAPVIEKRLRVHVGLVTQETLNCIMQEIKIKGASHTGNIAVVGQHPRNTGLTVF